MILSARLAVDLAGGRIDGEADVGDAACRSCPALVSRIGLRRIDPAIVADIGIVGVAGDDEVDRRIEPVEDRQQIAVDSVAALVVIADLRSTPWWIENDDRVGALGA